MSPLNPVRNLSLLQLTERDPQKITDLIEQLDRDLAETEKNTPKRQ